MAESDRRFMVDEELLEEIITWARIGQEDRVLEVGGGTGNLTERIAQYAKVTTIEYDRRLAGLLRKKFKGNDNVTVIEADAVRVKYPAFDKIVSNIPYSVSRELLERFICEGFDLALLVVQKEFAHKLLARPDTDNYRMVSVLAQSSCKIELKREIDPDAFEPKPKVKSSAILLRQEWKPPKEYITFLNTLFSQQNKKVRNIMDSPERYEQTRPCEMSPRAFNELYLEIGGKKEGTLKDSTAKDTADRIEPGNFL
jgi:16S rRNA (adenine1518-N6/adenine1519-N6)-dimethyltransferase